MKKRKKYQKPEIKVVKLTPEDAVLANCKADGGANMVAGRCSRIAACTNMSLGS
jgi:hypothetical protein